MQKWPRLLLKKSLNLIYPLNCVICGKRLNFDDSSYLCVDCYYKIIRNNPPFCVKCGCSLTKKKKINSDYVCINCQSKEFYFQRSWSVTKYSGITKELIHLFKYRRQRYLAKPLGKLMTDFIETNLDLQPIEILISVPLHSKKLRQREFNQAELLTKEISKQTHIPISHNLIRIKQSLSQTILPEEKRFSNIAGVFKIKETKEINRKSILLIDDVFTSGATANECALVLKQGGAKRIEVLTLAGR